MTIATASRHTEATVKRALWRHFTEQGYAVLTEVSLTDTAAGVSALRRIDVLCVRPARKLGIGPVELLAVEVKVARGDFLSDVRRPEKQAPWREAAQRHAYAVPAGLVVAEEVPAGSGMLVVDDAGRVKWDRRAPWADGGASPLSARMFTRMAYRAATAEATMRGWMGSAAHAETPAELRAEVTRLRSDLEKASAAASRAVSDRDAWKRHAASLTGLPCSSCGELIRPSSLDRYRSYRWRHVDKSHDAACEALRLAHADAEASKHGYTRGYANPVQPVEDTNPPGEAL